MLRDFLTDKWILGGVAFVIVFAVACVWWYHYDTAYDRQQDDKSDKELRQWEATQKASIQKTETQSEVTEITDAIFETETIDTMLETNLGPLKLNGAGHYVIPNNLTLYEYTQKMESTEVRYSPHGLGPYPEVPEEYLWQKGPTTWQMVYMFGTPTPNKNTELISRVLLKLWKEGDTEWQGAGIDPDGKIFVNYPNRVYIRYSPFTNLKGKVQKNPDGTPKRYISMWLSGDIPAPANEQLLDNDIPGGLEIIDLDVEDPRIEPYSFLGLD